jgi:ketol-acid reductoisomerase
VKISLEPDCPPRLGEQIAVVGFGSQGRAQALNLRDSGEDVRIGLRRGSRSWAAATEQGFRVLTVEEAVRESDVVVVLTPDVGQAALYREAIAPNLSTGAMLTFAHGFSVHYRQVVPPEYADVTLVAPKAPGRLLRDTYLAGHGAPCLLAVQQDRTGRANLRALAYARAIGAGRAGILHTTFREETETDLFGEQAVLCGGISGLITTAFDTLVSAGYPPELAYFEVLHELKLVVDLLYRGGMKFMRSSVSDTAEFGDYVSGPRVIDEHVRESMGQLLREVQDGSFAERWIDENGAGCRSFLEMRERHADHPIETVGARLRSMMPWLEEGGRR